MYILLYYWANKMMMMMMITQFLHAGCSSWCPTNSVNSKHWKHTANNCCQNTESNKASPSTYIFALLRLLGVIISSDLSLQHHVSNVYATSFYWLRQLRRVRRSLDSESAVTLVHAFVTSRIDQCNAILAGVTKSVTDTLQRVMNAAACVVSDTRKFDHGLTQILHDDLHWLNVANQVTYKLGVIMHRCWHGKALQDLSTVAHWSPMLSAGSVSGQPHSNWWWCHDIGYALLDAEHSLCMAPWSGTPCWTTSVHSRTTSPLVRAWKPGFSPDTSMFSALETFVIIVLYKPTFTVPYQLSIS